MSANVLSARDTNVQVKPAASPEKQQPKTMDYHRKMLQSQLGAKKTTQFVSPSDDIMSPATRKLSAHRGRNILKNSKPKTLFMKTSTKNHEATKDATVSFGDISKDETKES
ncbi:hypothetical protein P280DRAFT_471847 [Massarina eburnea CBS 473.64]|uniref:Uncharacterized protein n=1 Tax=Massarina eburnea CBS 473.64 TaxID=1395130 RepID=A0A6A6RTF0_9PLEO|nr:hypothetical protein P280DRAFT_471847 [Massarina eburnea CBS 473.64]